MSIFACEKCGVVENTATCGLLWKRVPCPGPHPDGHGLPDGEHPIDCWRCRRDPGFVNRRWLVCSECNPEVGRWHGHFPREDAVEAGYILIGAEGRPVRGDELLGRYITRPPWTCECGESDRAKRYGGPADWSNDGTDPCCACVDRAFAEAG